MSLTSEKKEIILGKYDKIVEENNQKKITLEDVAGILKEAEVQEEDIVQEHNKDMIICRDTLKSWMDCSDKMEVLLQMQIYENLRKQTIPGSENWKSQVQSANKQLSSWNFALIDSEIFLKALQLKGQSTDHIYNIYNYQLDKKQEKQQEKQLKQKENTEQKVKQENLEKQQEEKKENKKQDNEKEIQKVQNENQQTKKQKVIDQNDGNTLEKQQEQRKNVPEMEKENIQKPQRKFEWLQQFFNKYFKPHEKKQVEDKHVQLQACFNIGEQLKEKNEKINFKFVLNKEMKNTENLIQNDESKKFLMIQIEGKELQKIQDEVKKVSEFISVEKKNDNLLIRIETNSEISEIIEKIGKKVGEEYGETNEFFFEADIKFPQRDENKDTLFKKMLKGFRGQVKIKTNRSIWSSIRKNISQQNIEGGLILPTLLGVMSNSTLNLRFRQSKEIEGFLNKLGIAQLIQQTPTLSEIIKDVVKLIFEGDNLAFLVLKSIDGSQARKIKLSYIWKFCRVQLEIESCQMQNISIGWLKNEE